MGEQGEGVHTRVRIKPHALMNLNFFFSKTKHLLECINACGCLFPNSWIYPGMRIEKKLIENKDEYVSESVFDFGVLHDTTARRDTRPWLEHHRQLKKRETRAPEATREHSRWVFPSTFSLSRCLEFSWWECTGGFKGEKCPETDKNLKKNGNLIS